MTEGTMTAALVKGKADAEAWFIKMSAALKAAEDTMAQKMASEDLYTTWTKIRTESQTLLYLRDYQFSIGEELVLKKLQHTIDEYCSKIDYLKTSIALLLDNSNLARQGKLRSMATFERKERDKEIEIDSIQNEIKMLTNPCFVDSNSVRKRLELLAAKKASLEEKIRCCKLASFESTIKECDEQLRKKTAKLKRVEQKVLVAGESLKTMKEARRCCEEAIPMFELVFVHRLEKLSGCYVKFFESADVGIVERIYLLKHRFGGGFNLDFGVSTLDL